IPAVSPTEVWADVRHLAASMISFWAVLVSLSGVGIVVFQSAIAITVLGFLTTHRPVPAALAAEPMFAGLWYMLLVKPPYLEYQLIAWAMGTFSFLLAVLAGS